MKKIINDVKVNFDFFNNDFDTTILLLHGWGQNIKMMEPIKNKYKSRFNILSIDLPGFGDSDEPSYSWEVIDYVECVRKLILDLEIDDLIIIGHSFGGRVALLYSSLYEVNKLVCFGSPYCKEIIKLSIKTKIYKKIKKIKGMKWLAKIMQNRLGSIDYKNASSIMKGVLVKSVNLNMHDDVKKINCPTLLIWGDKDEAVSIERAYELEKLINDAAVIVYKNASHYAYLERLDEVCVVLNCFFNN